MLHGGGASNHPVWDVSRWGWNAYIAGLARDHRVIAPDMRGHGWTANPDGAVSYDLLAEDLLGLIRALNLVRPPVIGFSDGGILTTVLAIREPGAVGALVNIAGYDLFDPASPSMAMIRGYLGGSADAVKPDLERIEAAGGPGYDADITAHDGAQGSGAWRKMYADAFDRWTAPIGYTLGDLDRVSIPTLILAGDHDAFCRPEDSVAVFRRIKGSELAIVPNEAHRISPSMVAIALEFLARRQPAD